MQAHWIGSDYAKPGVAGNLISRTNVPDIRLQFRDETLTEERSYVSACAQKYTHKPTLVACCFFAFCFKLGLKWSTHPP